MHVRYSGFTLLEVLVALTILALGMTAVAPGFHTQAKFNYRAEIKTAAIQAAQLKLDRLRLLDPMTLPSTGTSNLEAILIGGREFVVESGYCEDSQYCVSNRMRHITVRVYYRDMQVYEIETVYTKLR